MLRPNRILGSMGTRTALLVGPMVYPTVNLRFSKLRSLPAGYGFSAITPPWTAGSIRTKLADTVSVAGTALGAMGVNLTATGAAAVVADAIGGLIAGGSASATVTVVADASLVAALLGEASATVDITAVATGSGLGFPVAIANITVSASGQPMGRGYMVATTEESGLTPAGIANAVWSSLAASYDVTGTMGAKLNSAGSASNPWDTPEGQQLLLQLLEVWKLNGLDASNPMTVTPTTRVAGDITQAITGDGKTTTTVTRA